MKHIEHAIEIEAPAAGTWAVIEDFATYGEWNPFMALSGDASEIGGRLTVTVAVGTRNMTFRPVVTAVVPGSSLTWRGRFVLPRLCDGTHELTVRDLGDGRSSFTQRETFRGMLVPFLPSMLRDTQAGFVAMGAALAARVEQVDAGRQGDPAGAAPRPGGPAAVARP